MNEKISFYYVTDQHQVLIAADSFDEAKKNYSKATSSKLLKEPVLITKEAAIELVADSYSEDNVLTGYHEALIKIRNSNLNEILLLDGCLV